MCQPGHVPRGIHARAGFVHHAAEISVRADFAAQLAFRNDAQFVIEFALDERSGFFIASEVHLLARDFEMAAAREVTVDVFLADDLLDAVDGVERGGVHFAHGFPAVVFDERRHRELHAAEDHAAVPRTGPPAESFRFEHGNFHAAFRERSRSGKSAESRADNGNIDAVRQIARRLRRRRGHRLDPVVFFFDRHEERQEAQGILASPGSRRNTRKEAM